MWSFSRDSCYNIFIENLVTGGKEYTHVLNILGSSFIFTITNPHNLVCVGYLVVPKYWHPLLL